MDFKLSDEQEMMQDGFARLVSESCADRRVHAAINQPTGGVDRALWEKVSAFGAAGALIPEAYGGAGLEMIDLALMSEVLGYNAAPIPLLGHALAGLAIALGGSDAQKQVWLPRLATGEVVGSVALAEGPARWSPDDWTLASGATLTGAKAFVPDGDGADLLVVGTRGGSGPALSLVDLRADGVAATLRREDMDGVDRTRRLSRIAFDATPAEAIPGGGATAQRLCDAALVLLAADAYGGGVRCVDMAVDYAKQREQFGVKIGQFQALRHQLAEMSIAMEPCRGLYWYAAYAFDHSVAESSQMAALAKALTTDNYLTVARSCIEAHGGIGYTWDYDAQIFLKRAMFDFAWLGEPRVHLDRAADLAGW